MWVTVAGLLSLSLFPHASLANPIARSCIERSDMRSLLLLAVGLALVPQLYALATAKVTRRAVLGGLATVSVSPALPVWAAPRNQAVLKDNLVLILRVKEATTQETRLITTGKYKELQRLNIKRAIKFMLDNYALRDRFVTASSYASVDNQQLATSYAQTAVEALIQIIEYFPQDLKANSLSNEQKNFVMSALGTTQKSIDSFLELMPAEAVSSALAQVAEENRLNEEEYQSEDGTKIINADPSMRAPAPPPADAPAPPPADAPADVAV